MERQKICHKFLIVSSYFWLWELNWNYLIWISPHDVTASDQAQTAATASNDVTHSFWRCQLKLISTFHRSIWLGFDYADLS